jgi:hypothetical protein
MAASFEWNDLLIIEAIGRPQLNLTAVQLACIHAHMERMLVVALKYVLDPFVFDACFIGYSAQLPRCSL